MTARTGSTAATRLDAASDDHAADVESALADLPSIEEQILRLRYGLGVRRRSQGETARTLAITVGRVRRAERRAICTLRAFSLPLDFANVPCPPSRRADRTIEPRAAEVPPGLVPRLVGAAASSLRRVQHRETEAQGTTGTKRRRGRAGPPVTG